MQIDYALILSAGLGTRMGEIGKKIPKVMWPILNLKLIDLQIAYCRELGIKKIYINTHYLAEVISEHIKSNYKDEVVILHEDPLLDSGGAIHNLAKQSEINYRGNVLTVNGDQFLFFHKKYFDEAIEKLSTSRAVLFGIVVDKAEKYNETLVSNDKLIEIRKNIGVSDYITFSGLGLIKLDQLEPISGVTKFFETVANYKKETISMIIPKEVEYWDFGTADIYFKNISKLLEEENKKTSFYSFLKNNKVDFNLKNAFYSKEKSSIDLEMKSHFEKSSIVYKQLIQSVI